MYKSANRLLTPATLQVATADVTATALSSPLLAQLTGPAGDVKTTSSIVLDATASKDPDDPKGNTPLSFTPEPAPHRTALDQEILERVAALSTALRLRFRAFVTSLDRWPSARFVDKA